ncbi:NADP-dependent oxidoreductase [Nocardia sp. alder85J]|uniref:NADP-dependent oxidoreductase n=1 Tax=Nocardia sp. alder85J TaxID=2862949 RepID=UPI001CD5D854|nr:NADP-dependent oxidoreductase [Nocardia sp. alder85J]MCX4095892.1 NADP-dependent oxidoreductase [Nocardia sp. alder85J]
MRAVVAHEYGTPEVLRVTETAVPQPGPRQILVRIRAAGLNPMDLRNLDGSVREMVPLSFPYTPGADFAGTVIDIGSDVTSFAPGDEIFGAGLPRGAAALADLLSTPASLTTGAMAEYAVFEADTPALAVRPPGLAADRAATLPIAGLTALALLRAGEFRTGHTALVVGAAGGVGCAVVPLLAAAGVRVVATAIAADQDLLRGLGAAEVIDYRAVGTAAETRRLFPDGVDAVLNLALTGPALREIGAVVATGGRLLDIVYGGPDPADSVRSDVRAHTVYGTAGPGDLDLLAEQAVAGILPDTVARRYPLADAPRAYADLAGAHIRGKLVVTVPGDDAPGR